MKKNIQNKLQSLKKFIISRKKTSLFLLLVLLTLGYFVGKKVFATPAENLYVTTIAERGVVVATVSGSGQVSASSQIDLKAKASNQIVYVPVRAGDTVYKGQLLFSLDAGSASRAVRDAEVSLESAKLSLEKIKTTNSEANMNTDLLKAYDDGLSAVSDVFLDLPSMLTGLKGVFSTQYLTDNDARNTGTVALGYKRSSEDLYYLAQTSFEKNRASFRLLNRNSSKADIEKSIAETYKTVTLFSDVIKSTKNYVDFMSEDTGKPANFTTTQTTLTGYTSTINGHLSNLSSIEASIENYKDSFVSGSLDVRSAELSVIQKENALQDARSTLSDYAVYAPFAGTIASVTAKVGDTASGTLGTLITNEKLATISLNEVDIANIKLGQKATLTFDAIDELSMTGEVVEIDQVGTVTSGVVSYTVKINFDISDERIKSGMSVSASIITDSVSDVIVVPNSAIKNQRGTSYVQTFDGPLTPPESGVQGSPAAVLPNQVEVTTGLSDDTSIEILSGLEEGAIVVTKVISGTKTGTQATTTPSLLNAVGGNRNGATRAIGGGMPRN